MKAKMTRRRASASSQLDRLAQLPLRFAKLTKEAALHAAIDETLRDAIARSAGQKPALLKSEKRAGMRVHGRAGQPCPACNDTVREVSFADSALQYCPTCQTGGKLLADRRLSKFVK